MARCSILLACGALVAAPLAAQSSGEDLARRAQNWETFKKLYPAKALQAGEQGMVGFVVSLDRDGHATECQVTHSSGYPTLDKETCSLVLFHGKFEPIRDASGKKIPSLAEGAVNWQVPGANGPAVPARPTPVAAGSAPEKMVCKKTVKAGTLAGIERTCMSRSEWARLTDETREPWDAMQGRKGNSFCDTAGVVAANQPGASAGGGASAGC